MHIVPLHADARASAREAARSALLERRLGQFRREVRPRVRAVAARHARLADLAASFPALLFALAVPRQGHDPARAIASVIDGASLRVVSEIAHVPLWLRAVEPMVFGAPLPVLPDGELFRRQIRNHLPPDPRAFDVWAQAVADANAWADQVVALWVASELRRETNELHIGMLRRICLWAWYSRNVDDGAAFAIGRRWNVSMRLGAAFVHSLNWLQTVELRLLMGDSPIEDMWLTPATVDGYVFVPLTTASAIVEEGRAMRHCVASYGDAVAQNRSRLWSVQRDGRRVATLEVGYPLDDPLPIVSQVSGVANKAVARDVWLAARRWLNAHDVEAIVYRGSWSASGLSWPGWRQMWRPYWLAKGRFPVWLPLRPSYDALHALSYSPVPRRRGRRRNRA